MKWFHTIVKKYHNIVKLLSIFEEKYEKKFWRVQVDRSNQSLISFYIFVSHSVVQSHWFKEKNERKKKELWCKTAMI